MLLDIGLLLSRNDPKSLPHSVYQSHCEDRKIYEQSSLYILRYDQQRSTMHGSHEAVARESPDLCSHLGTSNILAVRHEQWPLKIAARYSAFRCKSASLSSSYKSPFSYELPKFWLDRIAFYLIRNIPSMPSTQVLLTTRALRRR